MLSRHHLVDAPRGLPATSRPSGPAMRSADAPSRPSTSSRIRPPREVLGVEIAEDEVGVGDGGLECRPGHSRWDRRGARPSPGRPAACRFRRARSSRRRLRSRPGRWAWMFIGMPLPGWSRIRWSSNSRMVWRAAVGDEESFAVVPPMSKATRSACPVSFAVRRGHEGRRRPVRTRSCAQGSGPSSPRWRNAAAGLHDEEPAAVVERPERLLRRPRIVTDRGHHVRVDRSSSIRSYSRITGETSDDRLTAA
mgnify:CR=1 FL=1